MEDLGNIAKMPFDIRAEVLARLLAEKEELTVEQLLFRPCNYFQRWGRSDVLEISDDYSFNLEKTIYNFDVSREGLYDILPDSLFLHPDEPYPDEVAKSEALSEQEAAARKFLLPFDQLFYWLRIENEQREHQVELQIEYWWQKLLVEKGSPIDYSRLDTHQKELITFLLPYITDIIGDWTLTAQWLSLILNTSVQIEEVPPTLFVLPEKIKTRLGSGLLGQDFVLGDSFSDGIPGVQIKIEELLPDTLSNYLIDGKDRLLLEEELLPLFLPIETPYNIRLGLKMESTYFKLERKSNREILGYTTVLEKL